MTTILQTPAKLKPEFLYKIKKSKRIKALLMLHFDVSQSTINLWIEKNSSHFTQFGSLEILLNQFDCDSLVDLLTINEKKGMPMEE